RMVKESGVYDFFDRLPQPGQEKEYLRASDKHGIPILTGLWTYMAGRDEDLLLANLDLTCKAGGRCHNIMLFRDHADGHPLSNTEVVDFYRLAWNESQRRNIDITFEVHIYMWS